MCQSYHRPCACGSRESEIFFGGNVFGPSVVQQVYCPSCAGKVTLDPASTVQDNGWVLVFDPEVVSSHAQQLDARDETITADEVFDRNFVTWVGFTPEDNHVRNREREELAVQHAEDKRAHFMALKQWAVEREKRLAAEGWRKALRSGR
ncbi:MAG: hypothetical protein ABI333_22965 [bacterium]